MDSLGNLLLIIRYFMINTMEEESLVSKKDKGWGTLSYILMKLWYSIQVHLGNL